jgi:hypothetical protein
MQEAIAKQALKSKFNSAKGMFKVNTQEGNQCIFTMFFVFNFLIFLSSLGMLGGDIYLFVTLRPSIFQYVFLIISLVLLVFSLLSFYLKKSIHLLGFYLLIEFGTFIASMLSTILLYIMRESLINDVIEFNKEWDQAKRDEMKKILNDNIKNVFIAMLFFTLVLVSSFYIRSIGRCICFGLVLPFIRQGTHSRP